MHKEESMKIIESKIESARRRGLLLVGFKAWASPVVGPGAMRERLGGNRTRAVWDDPQRSGARMALTVTEHDSAAEALRALADELEANQLATLPPGPTDLGDVSFVHPEGVPPAVFFARANLTLWVTSLSPKGGADVVGVARAVDADLTRRPEAQPAERGASPGEYSYVKAFAPGAELRKSNGVAVGEGAIEMFFVPLPR